MSEEQANLVMLWIEGSSGRPWDEDQALLNHLYDMHKLRDEQLLRDLRALIVAKAELE